MKILSIFIIVLLSMGLTAQPDWKDLLINKNLSVPEGIRLSHNNGSPNNRSEPFRLDSFNHWTWNEPANEYDLFFRNIYSYNGEGLVNAVLELLVEGGNSSNSTVDSFYYDDEGRVIFRQLSGWTGNEWTGYFRFYTTYGEDSRQEIFQMYDGNEWVNRYKSNDEYDANGKLINSLNYDWDGADWNLNGRSIYHYNLEGLNDTILNERFINNMWENSFRLVYTYDVEGRITSYFNERFEAGEWSNYYLITYSYENGLQIAIEQPWSFNQWETESRVVRKFDDDRLIYLATSGWNGLEWMKIDSFYYYYSDLTSLEQYREDNYVVSAYPNPVQNTLVLKTKVDFSSNASIQIFSAAGERVYSDLLCQENRCEIEIHHLLPGLYFAMINNGPVQEGVKFLKL